MRRAFPDTALVRNYWASTHTHALNSPDVRLMVVLDNTASPSRIIALLRVSISSGKGNLDAGTWSAVPLTSHHDAELCRAFIDFMVLCRRRTMAGRKHYFLELVATVQEYKGSGAGRTLLEWVCGEADREGAAVFVETNTDIVGFYERFGFEVVERMKMPGGFGYEEWIMVRPVKGQGGGW